MDEKFHEDRGIKPKSSLALKSFILLVWSTFLCVFFMLLGMGVILSWKGFLWALKL